MKCLKKFDLFSRKIIIFCFRHQNPRIKSQIPHKHQYLTQRNELIAHTHTQFISNDINEFRIGNSNTKQTPI